MTTRFRYQAVGSSGRRERGSLEATTLEALAGSLADRGLILLDAEADSRTDTTQGTSTRGSRNAVLELTRALAALLPAGLPLPRAIDASRSVSPASLHPAIEQIRNAVEHGAALSSALAEHASLFPPAYIGVVRAGERSGELAGAFRRLAEQLERDERLRARLLSAMLYPMLLGLAGGAAVMVLLVLVLPRFADLLSESGGRVPSSTAGLLALGQGLRTYWLPALVVAVGAPAALVAWARGTPNGARAWSSLSLKLPLIGQFRRQSLSARFARLLGGLLAGGAPLVPALEDVERSIADPTAADEVGRIRARVTEGAQLRTALAEGTLWSPMLTQLVGVGEESGRLEQFLSKAGGIFEERTERNAQRLVSLLEPAMIVCFGGIVGFVALSLLQAIYSVNAASFR